MVLLKKPKKILVCGAGSIGKRHIANLLCLGAEVSVWRTRSNLLSEIAREFSVQTYVDLWEAIREVEAVVVATATDQHVDIATKILQTGRRALFIEKPLSHDWSGIDKLHHLAKGMIVEIGCQFRAHPNLIRLKRILNRLEYGRTLSYRLAMGHRLDAWRPNQDYQQGYSADGTRGGGALFDLIHQIDIALWLFGPVVAVQAVLSKIGDLNIRGDDVTNILLTHQSGVTGHIQLDMVSPVYRCEAEVITNKAILRWSNQEGILRCQLAESEIIADQVPQSFDRNDLFLNHMTHFLKRLEDGTLPALCAFEEGMAALQVAIEARNSS